MYIVTLPNLASSDGGLSFNSNLKTQQTIKDIFLEK